MSVLTQDIKYSIGAPAGRRCSRCCDRDPRDRHRLQRDGVRPRRRDDAAACAIHGSRQTRPHLSGLRFRHPASTAYPAYLDIAAMTECSPGSPRRRRRPRAGKARRPHQMAVDFATASYFSVLGLSRTRAVVRLRARPRRRGDGRGRNGQSMAFAIRRRSRGGRPHDPAQQPTRHDRRHRPTRLQRRGGHGRSDFWLSISSVGIGGPFRVANLERREDHWYGVKARLIPGVSVEQARGELQKLGPHVTASSSPELDEVETSRCSPTIRSACTRRSTRPDGGRRRLVRRLGSRAAPRV